MSNEIMKHLVQYDQVEVSDILETLQDAGYLNEEGQNFYSWHRENYYKGAVKKNEKVRDQLEESRKIMSEQDKKHLIDNRNKMKEVTRKFIESKI